MIQHLKAQKKARSGQRIEINVDRIDQLFNSMDPSPFPEKDLDDDAEEFIVSWAQEFHHADPLVLRIHVKQFSENQESARLIEKAVRNYFAYRRKLNRLEFRRLMKQGRTSLVIGSLFLAGCLLISELLGHYEHGPLITIARESLIIGGWVAMWRPIQIFLYEWWPLRNIGRIYLKLSHSPVELRGSRLDSARPDSKTRNFCTVNGNHRLSGRSAVHQLRIEKAKI